MLTRKLQQGFTLVELAVVILIVGVTLGVTMSLLPAQQDLKTYRKANEQIDDVIEKIYKFAQINGRLPCPASPSTAGLEDYILDDLVAPNNDVDSDGITDEVVACSNNYGFIPAQVLGILGDVNQDSLLLDPWGRPYRYYVTNSDFASSNFAAALAINPGFVAQDTQNMWDFFNADEMRAVGLQDSDADGLIDLDAKIIVCDVFSGNGNSCQAANDYVVGQPPDGNGDLVGAPFLVLSLGKNGAVQPVGGSIEEENAGNGAVTLAGGPSAATYDFASNPVFSRPNVGVSDTFDDVMKWGTTNELFSRLIKVGKLP